MEITGRLTADAKINKTATDSEVVNFCVAVNDKFKNRKGELKEITTYFNCSYWVNRTIAKHLIKGGLIELSGVLSAHAWKNDRDEALVSLDFHVNKIKLHGRSKNAASAAETSTLTNSNAKDDLPF